MIIVRAEHAADMRSAVAALPEPYREVVALRFFGDLSLEEIARQTDRPLSTVKTHLRRGLLRLRGTVSPEEPRERPWRTVRPVRAAHAGIRHRRGGATDAELADALLIARELESMAAGEAVRPSDGFDDRVMAAIALEPAPRLLVRRGSTGRGGRLAAFLVAFGDAWRVATTGGRPTAVRVQALAFVLLVLLAAGALTTVTAVGVGAFLSATDRRPRRSRPARRSDRPRSRPPSHPGRPRRATAPSHPSRKTDGNCRGARIRRHGNAEVGGDREAGLDPSRDAHASPDGDIACRGHPGAR